MTINTVSINDRSESYIDDQTYFDPSLWTWTVAGALLLSKELSGVKIMNNDFSYKEFAQSGQEYLQQKWGQERFIVQANHASNNFYKERKIAQDFNNAGGIIETVTFTIDLIHQLVEEYFLISLIDYGSLYQKNHGMSHYVLLYSQHKESLIFHDPGLPSRVSYKVNADIFMQAFFNELIAIPKPMWWDEEKSICPNDPCPCNSGKKNKKCHNIR